MILRMRRRFILISVAVISAALLLLASVINAVNWTSVRQEIADTACELADTSADNVRGKGRNQRQHRGESLYESRYFVVTERKSGITVDLSNVASYSEDDARQMYEQAQGIGAENGFLSDCFFQKITSGNSSIILFLDCGTKLDAVRQLLRISLFTCLAGILVSWLLMALLSKKAIQPLLENTEKQKRFITDASHELKTPLSVISANMEVMALDDPENEWIMSTRRQVGLMNRMVRDMVFLTRADEENHQPAMSELDLSQLVRDTAEPFAMMAEGSGRSFTIEAPEHLYVLGDAKGIERLISVLCDNAMKYSPEGDAISIRLSKKGAFATIETENTPAEPVTEEKLKHLFDRFYRGDEARTKKNDKTGFGIGLAIALAVAEAHGGTASATLSNGRIRISCRLKGCKSS